MDKVRTLLGWLTLVGWVTVLPLAVVFAVQPDHPARLLVILYGVAVVGVTMLWVQVWLLGDFLFAYMMGVHDAVEGLDPDPTKVQRERHLRLLG